MLRLLKINDFAIVDEALIEFGPGFNALTGETGAGKSILVEALGLALGERPSEEMIRTGAEQAVVEAVFDVSKSPGALNWLSELGMEHEGELIIRRIVSRAGKNRVFINGAISTAGQLKAVAETLADLHGQHESQALFDSASHLPFLDMFLKLDAERERYAMAFEKYNSAKGRLKALKENQREIERRLDLLKFQVEEIAKADIKPGEDEELEREKTRLTHTEKLLQLAAAAIEALDEGDGAATPLTYRAKNAMEQIAEVDEAMRPAAEQLAGALYQMEEAAGVIRGYAEGLERDPKRLEEVDDRLDMLRNLKKKYGDTLDEVIAYWKKSDEELKAIEFDRENMDRLEGETAKFGGETAKLALALDAKRCEGAADFSRKVEKQLKELNMAKARVEPMFYYDEEPESPCIKNGKPVRLSASGAGRMEILFSGNPGEPPKPLAKIASGGEISRIMLSLKTALTGAQPTPVMIFDEIDVGIGGVTGDRLGEKLRALAKTCQVFCVTHLAQVARQANNHYRVEKSVKKGKSGVTVSLLTRENRIVELARMATGEGATSETALKWAEEALDSVGG